MFPRYYARQFCLQPHRTEGFKFSTDPQLEAKVRDVVGLYLAPPENAGTLSRGGTDHCRGRARIVVAVGQ
jgi:hypothetical protein